VSRADAEALWGEAVVDLALARSTRPPSPELRRQIREACAGGDARFSRWALALPFDTFVCVVHVTASESLNDLLHPPIRSVS